MQLTPKARSSGSNSHLRVRYITLYQIYSPHGPTYLSEHTYSKWNSAIPSNCILPSMLSPNVHISICQIIYQNYWVGQNVRLGFSVTSYGKTRRNFLVNPIYTVQFSFPFLIFLLISTQKNHSSELCPNITFFYKGFLFHQVKLIYFLCLHNSVFTQLLK